MKTCATCKWWQLLGHQPGPMTDRIRMCVRRAPSYDPRGVPGDMTVDDLNAVAPRWMATGQFPTTLATDGCGDHEP